MNKKLNILIVTHYFPPQNSIASLRPYSWAKYWSQMGHDVTVLTTKKEKRPNDLRMDCSSFKIIEIDNIFRKKIKKIIGTENQYLEPGQVYGGNSLRSLLVKRVKMLTQQTGIFGTARMPDYNDFIINKSVKSLGNERFDFTISTSGPYSGHLIARKTKQEKKTRFWVADYRDLWTENHIFHGLFPFTLIEEHLERKVNTSADMISTVSEPLAEQIRQKYGLNNVEVIENGFDYDDLANLPKEKYWHDNIIRLVYTGSIYKEKRDPSPLFEAIQKLATSDKKGMLARLEVVFVGGGKANFDELIDIYHVSQWVKYNGFLPREDALRMQRDAHALIFLEFEAPNVDGILTGKLFEYLASGTQIIGVGVTDNSAPGKLIAESGHGINFGKDSDRIQDYLVNLLTTTEKPAIQINKKFIERYTRKAQAEKLLELAIRYKADCTRSI